MADYFHYALNLANNLIDLGEIIRPKDGKLGYLFQNERENLADNLRWIAERLDPSSKKNLIMLNWDQIDLLAEARRHYPTVPRRLLNRAKAARADGPGVVGYRNYDAAADIVHTARLPKCRR
ncbi:MAG: hypothetical protein WCO00_17825 [Rhodospirillaceae bacterium]